MKKVSTIFLLILFLIANSGVAVSLHWCGKKLASVEFFPDVEHNCPCGKRAMKPGCCKDKTIHIKVKKDLAKTNLFTLKISIPKLLSGFLSPFELFVPAAPQQFAIALFYHPPPYKPKTPAYLLHGVFLI